jgi:hypothetical protein
MNVRRSDRVILNLAGEIIIQGAHYASSIENLSEDGAYIITTPADKTASFSSDTELDLKFNFPSGEPQLLHCKVKWSYLTPPHGFTNSIGLEIIDPPLEYKGLLRSLQ